MINVWNGLQEKINKMSEDIENFRKDKPLKKNQMKVQDLENYNSCNSKVMEWDNNWLDATEERIGEFEDRSTEII